MSRVFRGLVMAVLGLAAMLVGSSVARVLLARALGPTSE
jgi:hypothetical protein